MLHWVRLGVEIGVGFGEEVGSRAGVVREAAEELVVEVGTGVP